LLVSGSALAAGSKVERKSMSWFRREHNKIEDTGVKTVRTEGLWVKCEACEQVIWKADLEANLMVCPKCGFHFRMGSTARIEMLLDPGFELVDRDLRSTDPLGFFDLKPYKERLEKAQKDTGLNDAIQNALGTLGNHRVVLWVLEFSFIARAVDRAHDTRQPLIIVSASGGARMMEGIVSLMQLAKVSTALARLDDAKVPYISLLTDPTTGGVTASFAMLGDLNIAEPGALIGFAGARVIEQTMRQKLPEGFQRSEFLLKHGFLDAVVNRKDLKGYLSRALDFMTKAA
jgi:acetyl-CoA carboxylase carboxyl transferase subunit beta